MKNCIQKLPVDDIFIIEDIPSVCIEGFWSNRMMRKEVGCGGRERERESEHGGGSRGMAMEFLDAVCARTEC